MNKGNIVYAIHSKRSSFGIVVKPLITIHTPLKLIVNWCNGNMANFDENLLVIADQEYIVYMLNKFGFLQSYLNITAIKEMLDGYKK